MIDPADYATWLGEQKASAEAIAALLRPYPAERMKARPVSTRVNDAVSRKRG